jgi:hypothetical protein
MTEPSTTSLPPISALFKDSWELFKKSAVPLLILNLINFAAIFVILLVLGLLLFALGLSSLISNPEKGLINMLTNPSSVLGMGLLLVIGVVTMVITGMVFQIAMIRTLFDPDKKHNLKELIQSSLPLVGPLFVVGLLSTLIILGGLGLFIIPGLVIALLLSFTNYEVIVNHQRGMNALKRSFALFSTNFLAIFGRLALFTGLSMLVSFVAPKEGELAFVMVLLNIVIGWFGLCFGVTLYKQVAERNKNLPGKSLTPIIITSIIGWVLGVGLLFSLAKSLSNLPNFNTTPPVMIREGEDLEIPTEEELNQMIQELEQESSTPLEDETI